VVFGIPPTETHLAFLHTEQASIEATRWV
jgi:hypothetical protein